MLKQLFDKILEERGISRPPEHLKQSRPGHTPKGSGTADLVEGVASGLA